MHCVYFKQQFMVILIIVVFIYVAGSELDTSEGVFKGKGHYATGDSYWRNSSVTVTHILSGMISMHNYFCFIITYLFRHTNYPI